MTVVRRIPAALVLAGVLWHTAAAAAELPKRKPGQWEISTEMSVMGGQKLVMQQCIDKDTDANLMAEAAKQPGECTPPKITRTANGAVVETTCKMEGSTVSTRGEFTGNFESAYRGQVLSTFAPPLQGMKESRMDINARWLGPCPAGQKPGSARMNIPGMGEINLEDMMKNMPKPPAR